MSIQQQTHIRLAGTFADDPIEAETDADGCEVSVVLPCLNEAETVGICVEQAIAALRTHRITGEVLVVDNGSTDGSAEIAQRAGARIISEPRRGYGNALKRGMHEAIGKYVVIADADGSYDLADVWRFVQALRDGSDLVMGSRRLGVIEAGAMPWLNRWIGNPVLSGMLNLLFNTRVSDAHCGMRALSREAFRRMQISTPGMELASEMVVKAVLAKMRIKEIPIRLRPDGRSRHGPHLRPFRDGWRHLRFMLLLSPTYLFLIPAVLLMSLGITALAALSWGPVRIDGVGFDFHYMMLGSLFAILGFQILMTGLFAKTYSHAMRLGSADRTLEFLKSWFSLERGIIIGVVLFLAGFAVDARVLADWLEHGRRALNAIRPATVASTLMIIGAQTIFSSFFLSMLLMLPSGGPHAEQFP
jgi:glycosyltransferase involved in cell wall biosynthesis